MKLITRSKDLRKVSIAGIFVAIGAAIVIAQVPTKYVPPDYNNMKVSSERDDLWFETNVGSFKILPRGDVLPSGDLTMSFTGSVLVSELKGTITPEGNVRREYSNKERNREVWFGTGKLTLKGNFRAIQWFGRDLKAKFSGNGFVRLYGEFDKNLDTGLFWFDPKEKRYWGNHGLGVGLPEQQFGVSPDTVKTREAPTKAAGGIQD